MKRSSENQHTQSNHIWIELSLSSPGLKYSHRPGHSFTTGESFNKHKIWGQVFCKYRPQEHIHDDFICQDWKVLLRYTWLNIAVGRFSIYKDEKHQKSQQKFQALHIDLNINHSLDVTCRISRFDDVGGDGREFQEIRRAILPVLKQASSQVVVLLSSCAGRPV